MQGNHRVVCLRYDRIICPGSAQASRGDMNLLFFKKVPGGSLRGRDRKENGGYLPKTRTRITLSMA